MKKLSYVVLFVFVLAAVGVAGERSSATRAPKPKKKQSMILSFNKRVDIHQTLKGFDVEKIKQLKDKPIYRVTFLTDTGKTDLTSSLYSALDGVASIEENQTVSVPEDALVSAATLDSAAIDSLAELDGMAMPILDELEGMAMPILDDIDQQYWGLFALQHIEQIRAHYAWNYTTGSGVMVAVLDTGVDFSHQFLLPSLLYGYDFVDDDSTPQDERSNLDTNGNGKIDEGWGHGTHVAGIIRSVAPHAKILPLRVADSDGQTDLFNLVDALSTAINVGADIINLSMSIPESSPLLNSYITAAEAANILVITSAGNNNTSQVEFPATVPQVVTVASLDFNKVKSPFSNYGSMVDVAAPGSGIYGCLPGDSYVSRSGTSMAAPMVAGLAALILELVPNASVSYQRHLIQDKAKSVDIYNPGYTGQLGHGIVDVWNSITVNDVKK